MSWYVAPTLHALKLELDGRWPHRDTQSDGFIGDQRHRARKSDHNPDPTSTPPGVVRAFDITTDGTIDDSLLLACLLAHPATYYVIYRGTIYDRNYGFRARDYTKIVPGGDPHTEHLHISILRGQENNTAHWLSSTNISEVDDMPYTPDQLKTLITDVLTEHMPSIVQAACDRAASSAVQGILHATITTMNPADGTPQQLPLATALGRAAEATIIRQAEKIDSADDTPTVQDVSNTDVLAAIMKGVDDIPDALQEELRKSARNLGAKRPTSNSK